MESLSVCSGSSSCTGIGDGAAVHLLQPSSAQATLMACAEDIRINPIVAKRGFLNILDDRTSNWMKRFVVVRRPFLFIYNNDKDPIERGFINLTNAQIIYNEEQISMLRVFI